MEGKQLIGRYLTLSAESNLIFLILDLITSKQTIEEYSPQPSLAHIRRFCHNSKILDIYLVISGVPTA
jgi:hypothetical protein